MSLTSDQLFAMLRQNMRTYPAPASVIHAPTHRTSDGQRQKLWLFLAVVAVLFFVLRMPGVSDMLFDLTRIIRIVSVMALTFGGIVVVGNIMQRQSAPEDHPMITTYSRPLSITSRRQAQALLASLASRPMSAVHEDDEDAVHEEDKGTNESTDADTGTNDDSNDDDNKTEAAASFEESPKLMKTPPDADGAGSDAPADAVVPPSSAKRTKKDKKSQQ